MRWHRTQRLGGLQFAVYWKSNLRRRADSSREHKFEQVCTLVTGLGAAAWLIHLVLYFSCSWAAELIVPFALFAGWDIGDARPTPHRLWRMNLYRAMIHPVIITRFGSF